LFDALEAAGAPDPREEMRLQAALGASTAGAIAASLGDTEYQLRALRGLYFYHIGNGNRLDP